VTSFIRAQEGMRWRFFYVRYPLDVSSSMFPVVGSHVPYTCVCAKLYVIECQSDLGGRILSCLAFILSD